MAVSQLEPAPEPAAAPRRDGRKRLAVLVLLLVVSSAMVWGTWLAIDDLRPKAMRAAVTLRDGALHLENTSGFAWSDIALTIDGAYRASSLGRLEAGAAVVLPLASFVDEHGQPLPPGEHPRELTATATRHSALGRVNGARPTSGRWPLP